MMTTSKLLIYIFIMAGVTYLIRMLPMSIFKQKIDNSFIRSFLYYIPYAVLGSMTFPAIFTSSASLWSAVAGTIVAVLLSFKEKGLLTVALAACSTVYVAELILRLF
jgi:branched-subunit amino acid transport protein